MRTLSVEQSQALLHALESTTEAIALLASTPDEPAADEPVYTIQEAGKFLQVSPSKIHQLMAAGELRYKDLRDPGTTKGLYRFLRSDLYAFMRE